MNENVRPQGVIDSSLNEIIFRVVLINQGMGLLMLLTDEYWFSI